MTSQSPRIYIYKITFEEVPYYYYGVKKEKYLNEEYWGSPYTNKWCWELYTPQKQILEVFPYTDEGWKEANKVEKRIIKQFYNADRWCLNENCGGTPSLEIKRKTGKRAKELKTGIFSLSEEQIKENSRISGINNRDFGVGIFSLTKEQLSECGKIGGKRGAETQRKLGLGLFSLNTEQRREIGKEAGKKGGKIGSRTTNAQKWMCLETGYVSNSGGLSKYQKARGIDTSKNNRRRIS
jgi:general stress protein YciG